LPIGEREPRPEKVQAVVELRELLAASAIILADYQGLDVKGISELRKKLREAGTGCRVVKNTLFKLAASDTAAAPLAEALVGPTAIMYTDDDPVAAAKALKDFGKAVKPVHVKSGLVDGHVLDAAQLEELAMIPPKQQLYAMVVGGLQSPITKLVGTLQSMIGRLAMTLQGVAEKKAAEA
jgi:large subunit ribosomal protein L10